MAKGYVAIPIGYRRVDNEPLEANTVFESYDRALHYASDDPTAYVGQVLSIVMAGGSVCRYVINESHGLSLIGREPIIVRPESSPYRLNHNTNSYPTIKCINSQGHEVMMDVTYINENSVELRWNGEFSGIVVFT